jgi:hypothetical protein
VIASFPALNELLLDPERLTSLYQKSTKVVFSFVAFSAVFLLIAGPTLLTLWISADFARDSAGLLSLHVLTFAVLGLATVIWQVNESFGAAMRNTMATFLWMVISIPLMLILSDGASSSTGVAAARLIGVSVFIPFLFLSERRFLGGQLGSLWAPALWRLILGGIIAAGLMYSTLWIGGENWASLVAAGALGFAGFVGILVLCGMFDKEELDLFRSILVRKPAGGSIL